jgi:hypothetical protein
VEDNSDVTSNSNEATKHNEAFNVDSGNAFANVNDTTENNSNGSTDNGTGDVHGTEPVTEPDQNKDIHVDKVSKSAIHTLIYHLLHTV